MTVRMIVAVTETGVMGVEGQIPWHYPLDMKRFARLTAGSTVVMGRKTWQTIGEPLAGRRNIVITSNPGMIGTKVDTFKSLREGLDASEGDVWLIGGERIYTEGIRLKLVQMIDVTIVPDVVNTYNKPDVVTIDIPRLIMRSYARDFSCVHDDPRLRVVRYHRMGSMDAMTLLRKHHYTLDIRVTGMCSLCSAAPATHLVGEQFTDDDPYPWRDNLKCVVCCACFVRLFGEAAGCDRD